MNWLNSIDNILEHGLVGRDNDQDTDDYTDYSHSAVSDRLDGDGTWSDNDDDSMDHHVRLAFASDNVIDEESEENAEEDDDATRNAEANTTTTGRAKKPVSNNTRQKQQETSGGRGMASAAVRPGNIRLRLMKNVSSSSSEEEEGESDEDNDKNIASADNPKISPKHNSSDSIKSKPLENFQSVQEGNSRASPVMAQEQQLLESPAVTTIDSAAGDSTKSSSSSIDDAKRSLMVSLLENKDKETETHADQKNQTPRLSPVSFSPNSNSPLEEENISSAESTTQTRNLELTPAVQSQEVASLSPQPKHPEISSSDQEQTQAPSNSTQTNDLGPAHSLSSSSTTTATGANPDRAQAISDYPPKYTENVANGNLSNSLQSNKQTLENKSNATKVEDPPTANAPSTGNSTNVSVASGSGWSWSASRSVDGHSDDGADPKRDSGGHAQKQAVVETSFLRETKETQQNDGATEQESAVQTKSTSSDDFSDEEVKTLASELEDLRALVDAVSKEDTQGHHAETDNSDSQLDQSIQLTSLRRSPQVTESIKQAAQTSPKGMDTNLVQPDEREGENHNSEGSHKRPPQPQRIAPSVTFKADADERTSETGLHDSSVKLHQSTDPGTSNANTIETATPPSPSEGNRFLKTWSEDLTRFASEPINCYGAVHLRILRAQRLPCPIGSTVQAIVSLPPWKGRARTERRTAFLLDQDAGSVDVGVCALWDDREGESAPTVSLVHAYTSEATPLPTLKIQLMLRPLKMLEFSICSLTVPCDVLMSRPGEWIRQWFLAETMGDAQTSKNGDVFGDEDRIPVMEIEAIFVPDDQSNLGSSFVNLGGDFNDPQVDDGSAIIEANPSDLSKEKIESTEDILEEKYVAKDDGGLVPAGNPHLLRVKKFWKPASCAQCSTSLFGWSKASFRCEACGLDCCGDCRLHIDVQIPCGSSQAIEIVGKAIQNKLTVGKFLEAMAPVDEEYTKKREQLVSPLDGELSLAGDTRTDTEAGTVSRAEKARIGVLKLSVARACVFRDVISAVSEVDEVVRQKGNLRPGDYYVRVCRTDSESSSRTRTIPSGGILKFEEASEMRLDVSHYGVSFFIEVVDAITDKPVGTTVLTTQGLLQQQRDLLRDSGKMAIINVGKRPPTFKDKRRMTKELRSGVKSGESSDFFVAFDSSAKQGEISGWVEISVGLEEDVGRLFGPTPYECPAPPADSLNLNTLNLHISRISDLIEDVVNLFGTYQYVVSWKNPLLTGFSFMVFVAFTLRFDAEYVGCLPFLFLMLFMLASGFSRHNCKNRFVQEEADEWKAAEKEIDVNYTLHRPVGKMNVAITKGKNIRSRELGLSGNVGCRVYYDPVRFATEKQQKRLFDLDKSSKTHHDIGCTESKFTSNPVWTNFNESEESRRLKQVLPHNGHFFESEEEEAQEMGTSFPVLQPFRKVDDDDENDKNPQHLNATLEPWTASTGGIVFQVRFRDILNMLPGSDHIFGEVAVPLATLVERREMSGWFQVLDAGTKAFIGANETITSRTPASGFTETDKTIVPETDADIPKVFLSLKWLAPEESTNSIETEREASVVIQEELLRWEATSRDKDKFKQFSVGAFNTISGFAGTLQIVQNFLGNLVNTVEAFRNLINFTDPYKSSMLLLVVTLLWLILSLLPTRLVLLVAGLVQFGFTAKSRLEKVFMTSDNNADDDSSQASGLDDEEDEDAPIIWLKNAFRGLPTDEDLRKAYFWEARRRGAKTREGYANEKRLARLERLWRAQWHATLKIRGDPKKRTKSGSGASWETIFAVVQGRRFLWWRSVTEFDNGGTPLGRIFLAGHAGLSGLSPLEMREIDPKDVPFVVGIFGRGLADQQRITLLLPGAELKDSLENAVIEASFKED